MSYKLTSEEVAWLDGIFTQVNEELRESLSKAGSTPLAYHVPEEVRIATERRTARLRGVLVRRAHAEDFIALEALGRVRLSKETRRAELKRLKRKHVKRKKYTFRYGRKHNKVIARNKRLRNESQWETKPLEKLRHTSRKPVNISQADWDRCIADVWKLYGRKHLRLRGGDKSYTIHNLLLYYHPPGGKEKPYCVYDGYSQAVYDSMKPPGQ